jgi:hypothetical protein
MITLKNIKQYIEGNSKMFLNDIGLQPEHIKEQISYRMLKCKDCLLKKQCIKCGCSVPGKLYVKESCNLERFPDLISRVEWEKYKIDNDIK